MNVKGLTGSQVPTWKAMLRGETQKRQVPQWLENVRQQAGGIEKRATAENIAALAETVGRFLSVTVSLAGEPVQVAGMLSKLNGFSRNDAYQALLAIAESDRQSQPVTIALEVAVALHHMEQVADVPRLAEISSVRRICSELAKLGFEVSDGSLHTLAKMTPQELDKVVSQHSGKNPLSIILDEWAQEGLPLYGNRPGTYKLDQIIEIAG